MLKCTADANQTSTLSTVCMQHTHTHTTTTTSVAAYLDPMPNRLATWFTLGRGLRLSWSASSKLRRGVRSSTELTWLGLQLRLGLGLAWAGSWLGLGLGLGSSPSARTAAS